MRIVGGKLSGRRFAGPPGDRTRPTSERVREAVASALEARGAIEGAVVLDLWAGTGALAFEALSRGAERAVLVEVDRRVSGSIERAAAELELGAQARVIQTDLERPIEGWIGRAAGPFDLVFCDPPYDRVERVGEVLGALAAAGSLAADAWVVVEHASRDAVELPAGFSEIRTYRYGDTSVLLGALTPEDESTPNDDRAPNDEALERP